MDTATYPEWFRLDPHGPHRRSGGLGSDGYNYEFYCTKDGQRWPCEDEQERERLRLRRQ